MRLTKEAQYALLACMHIRSVGRASSQRIATDLNLPGAMLEQITNKLRRTGILKSIRGPKGGYELTRDPLALDVINSVGETAILVEAPGHAAFQALNTQAEQMFAIPLSVFGFTGAPQ